MTDLFSLYKIAEEEEIVVDAFPMDRHVSFSLMDSDGDCYVAVDPNKLESSQHEKVVLGHELGHCMTGSFYNRYSPFDIRKRHENKANKWSIQRLIPKSELNEAVSAGFVEVWELAELFDVPCDYMAMACHFYKFGNMNFQT